MSIEKSMSATFQQARESSRNKISTELVEIYGEGIGQVVAKKYAQHQDRLDLLHSSARGLQPRRGPAAVPAIFDRTVIRRDAVSPQGRPSSSTPEPSPSRSRCKTSR